VREGAAFLQNSARKNRKNEPMKKKGQEKLGRKEPDDYDRKIRVCFHREGDSNARKPQEGLLRRQSDGTLRWVEPDFKEKVRVFKTRGEGET